MTTKPASVGLNRGIYDNPYDAFTNYMNILGDFINRVNTLYPADIDNEELNSLLTTIKNQGEEIEQKDKEIERLQKLLDKYQPSETAKTAPAPKAVKKAAPKKAEAKPAAKKAAPAEKKKPAAPKAAPKAKKK